MAVGEVIRRALQLAGLLEATQSPSKGDLELGRALLETLVDELQTQGLAARCSKFEAVTLTANIYQYTLDASTLDVFGDGMYIAASETNINKAHAETVVRQASRDEWQTISAKAAKGPPRLYYASLNLAVVGIRYWPIPDEAGTIRHQVTRHLADVDDDNATLDLHQYWVQPILWGLAEQLAVAKSLPLERASYLGQGYRSKIVLAKSMSGERTGSYFHFSHGG